jgi:hypothetical protein
MGTIDRVAIDKDGNVAPMEIKTYKTAPKRENWSYNFQLHVYSIALEQLIRQPIRQALYDGVRKKGPEPPKMLKKGGVSKAWIDTTYDDYIRVVRSVHGGDVPVQYLDILNRLKARDRSPMNAFVTRFRIPILRSALDQTRETLEVAAREMAYQPIIIPNKDWQGCPMCRVKDLCDATYAGENVDYLKQTNYRVDMTPTRKATHIATIDNVKSLDDLIKFSANSPHDPLGRHAIGSTEE